MEHRILKGFWRFVRGCVFLTMAGGIVVMVANGYRFASHATHAEGRVVASEDRTDPGDQYGAEGGRSVYRTLTYEFRDARGRAFRGSFNRPGCATRDERGERLRVVYDASAPSSNDPDDGTSPWTTLAFGSVVGLLGIALFGRIFLVAAA